MLVLHRPVLCIFGCVRNRDRGFRFFLLRCIATFLLYTAVFYRIFDLCNNEFHPEFLNRAIAVFDGFGKVVTGVDVQKREWNFCREKGFSCNMSHDYRIFPARKEQRLFFKLGCRFSHYEDRFRFEFIKMREIVLGHASSMITKADPGRNSLHGTWM